MSFIYPRLITVFRLPGFAAGAAGFGAQSYQEAQSAAVDQSVFASTPLYSNVRCSIQEYRSGQRPTEMLPGSAIVTPTWKVYIPLRALPKGALQTRDYFVDDLGIRYVVIDPYFNSLGHRAYCLFLEV